MNHNQRKAMWAKNNDNRLKAQTDNFWKPKTEGPCEGCGRITKRKTGSGLMTGFVCPSCHRKWS